MQGEQLKSYCSSVSFDDSLDQEFIGKRDEKWLNFMYFEG